ncbi:MAG TPA: ice-binding family protein, partial [Nitrospiria bacterium]|nr:ice-binding family protein [Nitrospiria bacterium]
MSKFKRMNKIFSGGLFVLMAGALLTGCADNILGGGGSPAGGGSAGPPVVTSVNPANGATKVAINRHITATFNKAMKPATLSSATFTVTGPGTTSVSGSVSYSGLTATFVPINALTASTGYTATVMTGARDLAGDPLASNYVWHFTTGTLVAQAPVYLGSANSFVVLAGSTVTNTGPTILNGDLGLSPGVSTSITGFPPGIVNGVVYSGVTSPAGQAKIDLTNAYTDAASRSTAPVTVTADLGGTTVYPGLYVSGSSMGITGDLTLDAQGDSEAVFIFQMPSSTLTTAVGSP